MQRIELLAPAKHFDAGKAAVDCGADAVYIGAGRFGARAGAGNGVQDIERLARYAHTYWARVYVVLNTLLYDREIAEAIQLIAQLYEAGIDGLIIQDVGLLECDLPPLPLIASTQLHNNTPEKIAFLEQVGFQRVILARELNLQQIAAIREQTRVELECFVHGALCVSYSGQCYLSYAIGGRSGNRGECAQPCRKRYTLKDRTGRIISHNRYLLSLKDMNRSDSLGALLDTGVTSFKIEGRLKDESYIKNIVSYYRRRLDAVLEEKDRQKSSSGRSTIDFTPDPAKTFNRGYTEYFLHDPAERVSSLDTPKSIGEPIGRVQSIGKNFFILAARETDTFIHPGDGLCFFDTTRMLQGTTVNSVQGWKIFPVRMQGLTTGTIVYRNSDRQFFKILNTSRIGRKIRLELTFSETSTGFLLSARDEDGNQVLEALIQEKELAKDREKALATINKQLCKLGETEFVCSQVQIDLPVPYFLPAARLNALRRGVIEQLRAFREQQRPRSIGGVIENVVPYPQQELDYSGNVLNKQAEAFYRRHGVKKIMPAAESGIDLLGQKVMTTKYCLKREFGLCEKERFSKRSIEEPLYLVDEHGQEYRLRFHCSTCEMEIFFGGVLDE